MDSVFIGPGNLHDKGIYANRSFKKGEIIKHYNIRIVSEEELAALSQEDRESTHTRNGIMYLYGEPDRYTNHSDSPNTVQDFENQCDIALHDIEKGEMITTDSSREDF
jgi:sialic acid synthase SpsE